jgi:hypothetical protein
MSIFEMLISDTKLSITEFLIISEKVFVVVSEVAVAASDASDASDAFIINNPPKCWFLEICGRSHILKRTVCSALLTAAQF